MTQAISADQPISTRIERVGNNWRAYVDPAWFRYFVDVGDVDLTADVSGILPVANGGTGVATLAPTVVPITAFLNGWSNFGPGWTSAGYFVDIFGIVHLQGLIASGTIGLPAFTLPVALRPAKQKTFAVSGETPPGRVDVTPAGAVIPQIGTNGFQSIEGITFLPGT